LRLPPALPRLPRAPVSLVPRALTLLPLPALGLVFFVDFFLVKRFFWISFRSLLSLPWRGPPQKVRRR
jgi:hypothetical protein